MLWLARLGLRGKIGPVRAGHGYADPSFRPSSLPYASLVGPLAIDVETERDLVAASDVLVQLPGFLRGAPRAGEALAAGTLELIFDQDASIQITLEAGSFATAAAAASICLDIETKLRSAATTAGFLDRGGNPISDPERVAELANIVCRWDSAESAVTLSSGRRGYVSRLLPSMVEITGGTAATTLGFELPARGAPGRHARHKAPAPTAFVVDVRLDLWAASQRDLGYLIDSLIQLLPTRSRMVTRPALLAADTLPGETALRLLDSGEPTTPESLLHLEVTDGLNDRVTGTDLDTTAGVTLESGPPPRLRLTGAGTASKVLARVPVVPDPRRTDALAPNGVSISLGVRWVGAAVGHSGLVFVLTSNEEPVLQLEYTVLSAALGEDPVDVVELHATALFRNDASALATASTTWRVPLSQLGAGGTLHVSAQSGPGLVTLALDGVAQDTSEPTQTPSVPLLAPGVFGIGEDLSLSLGNPSGNPAPLELSHVHLFSRVLPPLDPRLRLSVNGATSFRAGDIITLGSSERGLAPNGEVEAFFVRASAGDMVTLDRPVSRHWRRGHTIVHSREFFVQQSDVKRRDDLMNRLYRYCVGYRVSALLEQTDTAIVGSLVIRPVVDVVPKTSARPANGAPGVSARVLSEPVVIRKSQASQSQTSQE